MGWATADSVLRWHFVKLDWLTKKQQLSVRFTWMAAKETDEYRTQPTTFIEEDGTSLKAALDIARKFGTALASDLPFDPPMLFRGKLETFYARVAARKISSYFNLAKDVAHWKKWLATEGPILTRLDCDVNWMNCSGDGKLNTYDAASAQGGHAVALVGYTPDRLIVRNS